MVPAFWRFVAFWKFWRFLRNAVFSHKSDYFIKIPHESSFLKMYIFIHLALLVSSYDKNYFYKTLQNCEIGTILKFLNLKLLLYMGDTYKYNVHHQAIILATETYSKQPSMLCRQIVDAELLINRLQKKIIILCSSDHPVMLRFRYRMTQHFDGCIT